MVHELDDIWAQADCPVCGGNLNASKTMRFGLTVECLTCGQTIWPFDDAPNGRIQKLINDA